MAVEVALPCRVTGDQRRIRLLHGDEKRIVKRVVVELGHRFQVLFEAFGFKQFLESLFQLVSDFPDLLGVSVFSHFLPPILLI